MLHPSGWACQGLHCTFGNLLVPAWDQRRSLHSAISVPADPINPPSTFKPRCAAGNKCPQHWSGSLRAVPFYPLWGCCPLQWCLAQCHSRKQRMATDVLYLSKVRVAFAFQASEHLFHPEPQSCSRFPAWLRMYFISPTNVCVNLYKYLVLGWQEPPTITVQAVCVCSLIPSAWAFKNFHTGDGAEGIDCSRANLLSFTLEGSKHLLVCRHWESANFGRVYEKNVRKEACRWSCVCHLHVCFSFLKKGSTNQNLWEATALGLFTEHSISFHAYAKMHTVSHEITAPSKHKTCWKLCYAFYIYFPSPDCLYY